MVGQSRAPHQHFPKSRRDDIMVALSGCLNLVKKIVLKILRTKDLKD
jgi:hypothetical protein